MLSEILVLEVRRLLDETDLSQRAIADMLRVSRGTVWAISCGRRDLHGREEAGNCTPSAGDAEPTPVRCAGCGGLAYLPCRLCRVRAFQQRQRKIRFLAAWRGPAPQRPRQVA